MDNKNWIKTSLDEMLDLRDEYKGREFLILGNGPSLNYLSEEIVADYVVIACNNAWRSSAFNDSEPDFIFITDRNRAVELAKLTDLPKGKIVIGDHDSISPDITCYRELCESGALCIKQKVIPFFERHCYAATFLNYYPKVFSRIVDKKYPSFDPRVGYNFGYSVVVPAIQFAVSLGAKRLKLLGVDASSSNGAYFSAMPSDLRRDEEFLKNPRLTIEPGLAMLRAALDPMGIELLDASGGALTSLDKCTL